jgi:hypothetical protein
LAGTPGCWKAAKQIPYGNDRKKSKNKAKTERKTKTEPKTKAHPGFKIETEHPRE